MAERKVNLWRWLERILAIAGIGGLLWNLLTIRLATNEAMAAADEKVKADVIQRMDKLEKHFDNRLDDIKTLIENHK